MRATAYLPRAITGIPISNFITHSPNSLADIQPSLLDFKTQERYYTKIVDRYMSFCSQAGRADELLRRFSSLHLEDPPAATSTTASISKPAATHASAASAAATVPKNPSTSSLPSQPSDPQPNKDLSILLLATRKLREALVATHRIDTFSTQCYIFAIRLCILLRHHESYHPALLYLLRTIHPRLPLSGTELAEFAGYYVLDLACRQGELAEAFAARREFGLADGKVGAVLKALVHDDYWAFWRTKRAVDGYRARLMEWAEEGVRMQALKCLGRTYFTLEVQFVESVAGGRSWQELVTRDGVGWELQEGGKVVVRRVKGA